MFQSKLRKEYPYLCTPIVGTTSEELLDELEIVKEKGPDMIEWRVDYFQEIQDFERVAEVANAIKRVTPGTPLLFTIRSVAEGGNPTPLSPAEIVGLLSYICKHSCIDIIDYEIANPEEDTLHLRKVSRECGKSLILSYHDFTKTPSEDQLLQILKKAESLEADIAKIAVMPNSYSDVIRLLDITEQANRLIKIPVATMSMNGLGTVSRMIGWIFGSAIVFTVGAKSSAPGQVPIDKVREIIKTIKEYQ